MASDLGTNNVLFLRNHGLIAVGASISEAFMWMYRVERACRYQLAFQTSGAIPSVISSEIIASTFEQNRYANSSKGYRPIGLNEWPALLRKLDRENPGYAK
jgi:ribulose-5-phosphate 4-epimerase/fuculose-1-phosphate aldolase